MKNQEAQPHHTAEEIISVMKAEEGGERSLNVIFNYNGHSWEAYEILGAIPGSSQEEVKVSFNKSLSSVTADSREFIEAAYRAICQKNNWPS